MLCLICFQGNCARAPDKNKLQKKKHYRGLSPNGIFSQVIIPVLSSSIPAPCIHKIPVILGSFAFCREITEHERKKMHIFSLLSGSKKHKRRKIANHLLQLTEIAGLAHVVQGIINFPFHPVTWMYPVVKCPVQAHVPIPKALLKLTSASSKSKGNLVHSTRPKTCLKIAHTEQHVFHSYRQPSYI